MRLCFVLPAKQSDQVYTSGFLMTWTDLFLKCVQRGHQVFVSQQDNRPECFTSSGTEVFDAYVCIDPDVIFTAADVFKLLESPHDVTGALMMSSDAAHLTCGKRPDEVSSDQYMEVDALEPSFVAIQKIPEGWNYTDKIKAHVDTSVRVGHRVTLNI